MLAVETWTEWKIYVKKYNATLTAVQACKQAVDVRGTLKCENPGNCPGQAAKILHFKNKGARIFLSGIAVIVRIPLWDPLPR